MRFDSRDYIVGAIVTGMWIYACVFLWRHPSDMNFGTWAAVCTTMTCVYHWINVKDDHAP